MQAGLVAMRNLEAERKLLAEESTERKRRRPSQRVQKTTEHAHHFWSNVKKTQQTNLGSRIVNMHTLVEDATLHNAREARRAKITTFWVEGANYVIHPKAPKKMMWDLFVAAFILYSVLIVPFKLGFGVVDPVLDVVDIFVDVVFWVDLILSFNTGYYDSETNDFVTDHKLVALHYAKGWLAVDFFSTFPTYRIARSVATPGTNSDATRTFQLIRALRLIRLLKLARLLKMKRLTRYLKDADINPGVLRIGSLMSKILFVAHLFACVWHGIGVESQKMYGMSWIVEFGAISEPLFARYVMSLYFTVATMMAVGYGDIYATTTLERGFAIITQIVGALVFGWILATVAVFYESADPRVAEIMRRTKKLQAFMRDRGLPKKIQREILQAFEYRYAHKSVFDEHSVLNSVSRTLGNKIISEAYKRDIDRISFLNKADISLCSLLCREMRPLHMHQDRVVYENGRMSSGLFFVKTGVVAAFLKLSDGAKVETGDTVEKVEKVEKENNTMVRHPSFHSATTTTRSFSIVDITETTNDNETLISVFDKGSHFGHDASVFAGEKKQQSKLQVRVAKSCDLLLVPDEALQRLIGLSENFRIYLQEDAFERQKQLDDAIDRFHTEGPTQFVPLYNGHSEEDENELLSATDDANDIDKKNESITRRKLSFRIATQASTRVLMGDHGDIDTGSLDDTTTSTYTSASDPTIIPSNTPTTSTTTTTPNTSKNNAQVLPLDKSELSIEEHMALIRKKKKIQSFLCERTSNSLSPKELEDYKRNGTSDYNQTYVQTWETHASLLRLKFIHPHYGPKMKFDLLVALFIVWSVIILPYRIAFDDIPTWEANPGAYVFEWCVDFIFLIDIFCSFRTTFVARGDQICIVSTKKIARNYLESWFFVDVMSTLPLDLIIEGIVTATSPTGADGEQNLEFLKLIRIVRLIRLIKLARLFKLGKLADSISEFIDSPYLLQLVTLLLMTVFVSHLLGCFWFLISPYHIMDPTQTWWGGSMLADTKADHYLASVYWSFSTMTTVGYGDIVPQSTSERLYAVVAMIIGATIFGYVIGNVASMSMTADIAGMRKQERITNVLGYMKEKNVSTELKRKVESYLEFYFEHCSGFEDTSLIDELPEQLQSRVHEFLHGPTVDKFTKTLFKDIRRDAATRIISKLRTEVFVTGDILFMQGDIGQAMYLVEKGVVLCVTDIDTPKEKIIRKQIEGSHFGQYSMLGKGDIPHPFTAAVAESTVVLVMSRANVGVMVEEEAMLGEELQKLFTEHVRFSVTAEQRKGLAKSEDTSFSVAPSVNRMMLRKVQSYKKKSVVSIGEGENGGEAGVEEDAGRSEMKEEPSNLK